MFNKYLVVDVETHVVLRFSDISWAISCSALNQFFPQNLLLIFTFTKSWRNRCRLWVWRSTGHTFVLLHSTHVHALGLIAVASKFVRVCHRTTNWFFRETRQLLTRCQRCKILLRSHVCLICTSKYFMYISCATRYFYTIMTRWFIIALPDCDPWVKAKSVKLH